jgi:hypothetical protein
MQRTSANGWLRFLRNMRAVAVLLVALVVAASAHSGEQSDREFLRLMVGAWRSPRHDYVYLNDATWWMGKPDPNGPEPPVTHGRWRIENHSLVTSARTWEASYRRLGKKSAIRSKNLHVLRSFTAAYIVRHALDSNMSMKNDDLINTWPPKFFASVATSSKK